MKTQLIVKSFDKEVKEALIFHCQQVLGHRGCSRYLEALIKKDLKLNK